MFFCSTYSSKQVVSNTDNDDLVVEAVQRAFKETIFGGSVETQYYSGMLSFSEKTLPNAFRIFDNENMIYEKQLRGAAGQMHPYIAYSEDGTEKVLFSCTTSCTVHQCILLYKY